MYYGHILVLRMSPKVPIDFESVKHYIACSTYMYTCMIPERQLQVYFYIKFFLLLSLFYM